MLYLGLPVNLVGKAVYALRDGNVGVFTITSTLVNRLHPAIDSLISRQVFDIEPTEIRGITLDGPGGVLQFSRTTESWSLATHEAPAFIPDGAEVSALLELLTTPLDGIIVGNLKPEDYFATASVQSFRSAADDALIAQLGSSEVDGMFRILIDSGDGVIRYSKRHSVPGLSASDYAVPIPPDSNSAGDDGLEDGVIFEEPTK